MGLKGKIFKFMSDILKDGSYYKLYTQAKSTSAFGLMFFLAWVYKKPYQKPGFLTGRNDGSRLDLVPELTPIIKNSNPLVGATLVRLSRDWINSVLQKKLTLTGQDLTKKSGLHIYLQKNMHCDLCLVFQSSFIKQRIFKTPHFKNRLNCKFYYNSNKKT